MATYRVLVTVNFDYEVEADSAEEAREKGWEWEDHRYASEVFEITAELQEDEDEDEE